MTWIVANIFWTLVMLTLGYQQHERTYSDFVYNGCNFKGTDYREGSNLTSTCFVMQCQSNQWIFRGINSQCAECRVCNDPHFKTFDGKYYDWHGMFNYSLSQPFHCQGRCNYSTENGIYSSFTRCSPKSLVSSCLGETIYKVDPYTAVKIVPKGLNRYLVINGKLLNLRGSPSIPMNTMNCQNIFPVIIWSNSTSSCAFIVGEHYSIKACRNGLYIFTHPANLNKTAGLCGYYSGTSDDDFLTRDKCFITENVASFASTWTTLQQSDNYCYGRVITYPNTSNIDIPIKKWCNTGLYLRDCREAVKNGTNECISPMTKNDRVDITENCLEDCCNNPESSKNWISNARDVAFQVCDNANMKINMTKT